MNPNIPIYLSAFIIIIAALILIFIFYAVNYAYINTAKKRLYVLLTMISIIAWLIITSVIAFIGTLLDFNTTPPKMMVIIIPAVLALIYLCNSERVNNILKVMPAGWLIYVQSFRILVEVFLWLMYKNGSIPVQMTFEGLNYDILIGLSAPIIAYYSFNEKKWPKIVPLLWNFAGSLLLANIVIISFLSAPMPFRQFFNEPANTLPAYFPFVWLPAFIVPFAFLIHILSIKQIMRYN
ncbi:MAG TPA: hypothetical protein VGK25_13890 [Ignavibacteria bacterium]|jgi:hypothetical protein